MSNQSINFHEKEDGTICVRRVKSVTESFTDKIIVGGLRESSKSFLSAIFTDIFEIPLGMKRYKKLMGNQQ